MMRALFGCLILVAVTGCSASDEKPAPKKYAAGITSEGDHLNFATEDFEVQPGKERFLCYAANIADAVSLSTYRFKAKTGIHHLVLAQTSKLAPEKDGFSECDVLFRSTWSPLFVATTADTELAIPKGAANVIDSGAQLLIQLHLLNNTKDVIRDQAVVEMTRSTEAAPSPAGLYVFGTTNINLPPQQPTALTSNCTPQRDVKLFAMLPHMHYLGTSLTLEAGPDENSLVPIFTRDPYSFDNQELSLVDLTIPAGYKTRTTCKFNNTRDEAVKFGESSLNEMCFAIGFGLDIKSITGCFEQYPHDPNAGECKDVVPNDLGIGKPCTATGNECPDPLQCSAKFASGSTSGTGICLKLGCEATAECGGGSAKCCSFSGIQNLCIPEACRPLQCAPL